MSEHTVLLATQRHVAKLEAENARLRAALVEIRDHQGAVCDNYEHCNHAACDSSYASWSIADKALKGGDA